MNAPRGAIGLADWLQALHRLRLKGPAEAAALARLLGLAEAPAAQADAGLPPLLVPPPRPPPPPVLAPPLPPAPKVDRGAQVSQWRGGALQLEALPPAPRPPAPGFAQAPLAAAGPPVAAALPPLLEPATARALLVALASAPAPSGEVDVARLAAQLLGGRPLRRLPERWRPSLRRGVQVLVDAAPGMEPFERDARQLVAALRALVPGPALQSGHWLGGAQLGCWMDGARRAQPWRPPPAGSVLLLLTDFSRGGWLPLARAAAAHGVLLRALVPRPPAEWPAAARRHLQPLHWERSLAVAALRAGAAAPPQPLPPALRAQRVRELAARASLAVRVDPPLLRRLRLQLPGADAGVEAALWAGEWVESHGVEGFVLNATELPALRAELAATPGALAQAWQATQAAHARWPAALRLEERLTWLGLQDGPVDWDAEWEPALAAIAEGGERATEMARWAVRALPRLPPAARETDAARAVLLAAALRAGAPARTLAGPMPEAHRWVLQPPDAKSEWTVEGAGRALLLRPRLPADPPGRVLRLPVTRPPLVELVWVQDGATQRRLCPVQAGQPLPLPDEAAGVVLRALGGEGWRVLAAGAPPTADERWRGWTALLFAHGRFVGMGVQVAPGQLVTAQAVVDWQGPVVFDEVRIGAQRAFRLAADAVRDTDDGLLLLSLRGASALPGAVAEIAQQPPSAQPWPVDLGDWRDGLEPRLVRGEASPLEPGRLRLQRALQQPQPQPQQQQQAGARPAVPGAPLLDHGRLAGLALDGERAADGASVLRFMAWAMREPPQWPAVLLALPRGDAKWMHEGAAPLLASLRLRESRTGRDGPPAAALIALPPKPNADSREQELRVALHGWADPLFGVVVAGEGAPALRFFAGLPRHDLRGPALRAALHEAVDGPGRRRRQVPTPADVRAELRQLVLASGRADLAGALPGPVDPQRDRAALEALVRHFVARGEQPTARQALALAVQDALGSGPWLQRLAEPAAGPPRWMGVVPAHLARLALAKAFHTSTPWRSLALRRPVETADQLCGEVAQAAALDTGAEPAAARRALAALHAPFFVLLMHPLPPAGLLAEAGRQLPGARFIGLSMPGTMPRGYEPLGLELPDGGLPLVKQLYKPLAELIDPRAQAGSAKPKLARRKESRR